MIYKYSELKNRLADIVYSDIIEEAKEFIQCIQNKALEEVGKSDTLIGKRQYTLPRTDANLIYYLKSLLDFYEYKYEIKRITDFSGSKTIVEITWDLDLNL